MEKEIVKNYIDLFAGIGGFALGAHMAGFKCDNHFFCEVDPFAIKLYQLRFPGAINLGDITKVDWEQLKKDYPGYWVISGGFPCQDISIAGKGAGLDGKRSGLWFEFWRGIRILRPKYVIAENVSAITFRGLDRVISSLAEIGYAAEWQNIRASDMGAPHRRERIWIIAYPDSRASGSTIKSESIQKKQPKFSSNSRVTSYPNGKSKSNVSIDDKESSNTNSNSINVQRSFRRINDKKIWEVSRARQIGFLRSFSENARCKYGESWAKVAELLQRQHPKWNSCNSSKRSVQTHSRNKTSTRTTRVDDGIPSRVDRLKGCGNAIVPQIAKLLFELCEERFN